MFILSNMAVQMYLMQQERQRQAIFFEARVRETQTPAYVSREAPRNIESWVSARTDRTDICPDNPLTLNLEQAKELREFLTGRTALGAVAAQGGRGNVLGPIPGVRYSLGERAQQALDQAIIDFGIQIVDDRI